MSNQHNSLNEAERSRSSSFHARWGWDPIAACIESDCHDSIAEFSEL